MNELHRTVLTKNQVFLVQNLMFDTIQDHMLEAGILDADTIEEINVSIFNYQISHK